MNAPNAKKRLLLIFHCRETNFDFLPYAQSSNGRQKGFRFWILLKCSVISWDWLHEGRSRLNWTFHCINLHCPSWATSIQQSILGKVNMASNTCCETARSSRSCSRRTYYITLNSQETDRLHDLVLHVSFCFSSTRARLTVNQRLNLRGVAGQQLGTATR